MKALPLKVPAITLARLAVTLAEQKKGHGERLLLDAMYQVKAASGLIGGSFLFVDSKDTELSFYTRYGFVPLADSPLTLCMPITQIP
ncbi:GNAT family N-acetyltransferase [Methylomonas sp. AM2-LC]|uniref:GNAT family N-acetyltransferase n=1 Tax=Methylomonas sp. AM2-LC TaxID=3153301 RepID=UPI003267A357